MVILDDTNTDEDETRPNAPRRIDDTGQGSSRGHVEDEPSSDDYGGDNGEYTVFYWRLDKN